MSVKQGLGQIQSFAPLPIWKLNFPTPAVVSSDDFGCGRALAFARSLGARQMLAGGCGHIHVEAGFGPWSGGEAILRELL